MIPNSVLSINRLIDVLIQTQWHDLFYAVANSRAEVKGIFHRYDGEEADVQKGTRRPT